MGDKHRISRDFSDPAFVKLLRDMERSRVHHNLSSFFTRPAYEYTKAEVGGLMHGVQNLR